MADDSEQRPDDGRGMSQWGTMASMGSEFVLSILLPGALGFWIDRKWGTTPWWMLGLGVFGFGAGLYRTLRAVKQLMK